MSNINSSELLHVQIHTVVFSHISSSSVPGSLSNNLTVAADEALALKISRKLLLVMLQG